MHRSAVTNAAILHHQDDDVALHNHWKAFISLFSALTDFKEHTSQKTPLSDCF